MPDRDPSRLLSNNEAAACLGIKPQTLRRWRWEGTGPSYVRLGNSVKSKTAYRPADLEAWLKSRTFAHTAEESAT
jgi:predicted DNA-binding transcriptional regulator AlpA